VVSDNTTPTDGPKNSRSSVSAQAQSVSSGTASISGAGLKVIPLGGLGEIGKNTMVLRYGNDMILVDAGLAFPSEDMLGVDLVLPDYSFLVENQDKIRGLVITHGHEDHIGGIPFILRHLSIPVIYGPSLALGLLEGKLAEVGLEDRTVMRKVKPRQEVKIGCFSVKFIRCTHSIADSYSLIIRTPVGNVVHTGDFKFDFTPVDGEQYDIASLTAAAEEGVLLLMSDSTNVEREGFTPSERTVWRKLDEIFANAKKRIIVTTFASNVHRVRQVLQAAMKYERKVTVLGRSMLNLAGIARELGYMTYPDGLIIPPEETRKLPMDKVVVLTTGSQGEPLSALTRIANDEHKQIKIVAGDTVIISATPIPGNERSIANTINALFVRGADVIYGRNAGVHVSGHACREEQKMMINFCKPKFFMPVHGEYRMLVRHGELAEECGISGQNVFVMENGDVLEVFKDRAQKQAAIKAGVVLVDSSREWEIDDQIVEQRRHLAEDGMVTVAVTLDRGKRIAAGPDISMKGLILPRGLSPEEFLVRLKAEVESILEKGAVAAKSHGMDLRTYLQHELVNFFVEKMKSRPLVQIVLQEVVTNAPRTKPQSTKSTSRD
jgi:ribonuclease J